MKNIKKFVTMLLTLTMVLMMSQVAFAQSYDGGTFSYSGGNKINNSSAESSIDEEIANLQPGDEMTFTFTYKNDSSVSTEWYLENTVVHTLEEQGASNGGYSYELTNNGKKEGTVTIFKSSAVAGDDSQNPDSSDKGLKAATNATGDWLYIDTLAPGQSGTTVLKVALDGESQANSYENTKGQLMIAYAVEETAVGEDVVKHVSGVNTGDQTNILLPVIVFLGGLVCLILAVISFRRDRKDGEEA